MAWMLIIPSYFLCVVIERHTEVQSILLILLTEIIILACVFVFVVQVATTVARFSLHPLTLQQTTSDQPE